MGEKGDGLSEVLKEKTTVLGRGRGQRIHYNEEIFKTIPANPEFLNSSVPQLGRGRGQRMVQSKSLNILSTASNNLTESVTPSYRAKVATSMSNKSQSLAETVEPKVETVPLFTLEPEDCLPVPNNIRRLARMKTKCSQVLPNELKSQTKTAALTAARMVNLPISNKPAETEDSLLLMKSDVPSNKTILAERLVRTFPHSVETKSTQRVFDEFNLPMKTVPLSVEPKNTFPLSKTRIEIAQLLTLQSEVSLPECKKTINLARTLPSTVEHKHAISVCDKSNYKIETVPRTKDPSGILPVSKTLIEPVGLLDPELRLPESKETLAKNVTSTMEPKSNLLVPNVSMHLIKKTPQTIEKKENFPISNNRFKGLSVSTKKQGIFSSKCECRNADKLKVTLPPTVESVSARTVFDESIHSTERAALTAESKAALHGFSYDRNMLQALGARMLHKANDELVNSHFKEQPKMPLSAGTCTMAGNKEVSIPVSTKEHANILEKGYGETSQSNREVSNTIPVSPNISPVPPLGRGRGRLAKCSKSMATKLNSMADATSTPVGSKAALPLSNMPQGLAETLAHTAELKPTLPGSRTQVEAGKLLNVTPEVCLPLNGNKQSFTRTFPPTDGLISAIPVSDEFNCKVETAVVTEGPINVSSKSKSREETVSLSIVQPEFCLPSSIIRSIARTLPPTKEAKGDLSVSDKNTPIETEPLTLGTKLTLAGSKTQLETMPLTNMKAEGFSTESSSTKTLAKLSSPTVKLKYNMLVSDESNYPLEAAPLNAELKVDVQQNSVSYDRTTLQALRARCSKKENDYLVDQPYKESPQLLSSSSNKVLSYDRAMLQALGARCSQKKNDYVVEQTYKESPQLPSSAGNKIISYDRTMLKALGARCSTKKNDYLVEQPYKESPQLPSSAGKKVISYDRTMLKALGGAQFGRKENDNMLEQPYKESPQLQSSAVTKVVSYDRTMLQTLGDRCSPKEKDYVVEQHCKESPWPLSSQGTSNTAGNKEVSASVKKKENANILEKEYGKSSHSNGEVSNTIPASPKIIPVPSVPQLGRGRGRLAKSSKGMVTKLYSVAAATTTPVGSKVALPLSNMPQSLPEKLAQTAEPKSTLPGSRTQVEAVELLTVKPEICLPVHGIKQSFTRTLSLTDGPMSAIPVSDEFNCKDEPVVVTEGPINVFSKMSKSRGEIVSLSTVEPEFSLPSSIIRKLARPLSLTEELQSDLSVCDKNILIETASLTVGTKVTLAGSKTQFENMPLINMKAEGFHTESSSPKTSPPTLKPKCDMLVSDESKYPVEAAQLNAELKVNIQQHTVSYDRNTLQALGCSKEENNYVVEQPHKESPQLPSSAGNKVVSYDRAMLQALRARCSKKENYYEVEQSYKELSQLPSSTVNKVVSYDRAMLQALGARYSQKENDYEVQQPYKGSPQLS